MKDPEGELIAVELSSVWVKIVRHFILCSMAKNKNPCYFMIKWVWELKNLHWNNLFSIIQAREQNFLKHFLTWSTDFGFLLYLSLFVALNPSPNHKYKEANRFQN